MATYSAAIKVSAKIFVNTGVPLTYTVPADSYAIVSVQTAGAITIDGVAITGIGANLNIHLGPGAVITVGAGASSVIYGVLFTNGP